MKVLVVVACVLAVAAGKSLDPNAPLPSSLKVCSRNDPKRDECIKDSIQSLLPAIKQKQEGIALPAIDPFSYEQVTFSYKNSQILTGSFTVRNVKSYGMSRAKIHSLKSDVTDNTLTIVAESSIPKLFSTGNYNSSMTFNSLKLESKGQFNVTMRDIKAKWNIKGKLQTIDGEDYMKIYKFDLLPEANDMKISVSGMFPDENLNKFANDFFNQYWRVLYKEMIPETRKQWEPILLQLVNKFFDQIPFRRLLL